MIAAAMPLSRVPLPLPLPCADYCSFSLLQVPLCDGHLCAGHLIQGWRAAGVRHPRCAGQPAGGSVHQSLPCCWPMPSLDILARSDATLCLLQCYEGRHLSKHDACTPLLHPPWACPAPPPTCTAGAYGSTKRYKSFERLRKVNDVCVVGASGELSDFQYIMR